MAERLGRRGEGSKGPHSIGETQVLAPQPAVERYESESNHVLGRDKWCWMKVEFVRRGRDNVVPVLVTFAWYVL